MADSQQRAGTADASRTLVNTASKTVTDTVVGEHTHTIVGYSLVKGIGDGEPIASERFTVGGHEWVLLFYPDGKRSSSSDPHLGGGGGGEHAALPPPAAGAPAGVPGAPHLLLPPAAGAAPAPPADAAGEAPQAAAGQIVPAAAAGQVVPAAAAAPPQANAAPPQQQHPHHHHPQVMQAAQRGGRARDTTSEYAALFVALIGEGPNPQGVVNTSEGKVVRAFHRFTLVDQTGGGRDLTKGRTRDAGAVKISFSARQDPNARNCHGYRKFVKRAILEDPSRGYLVNDTIVIKYTIELVVSSGGALSRNSASVAVKELIKVPPPTLGKDLVDLFYSGSGTDYVIAVADEEIRVHKFVLEARSPVFRALLNSPMQESAAGRVTLHDIQPTVFKALLHFVYTDALPEELEGAGLEVPMAQHLLVAADQYQLIRLRRICERRLCDTVDVETAATTLTLAEQNHAEELKRVCLEFVSRNLQQVMVTDGYRHMTRSCPQLQAELLQTIATSVAPHERAHGPHVHRAHPHVRPREGDTADAERRVRRRQGDAC